MEKSKYSKAKKSIQVFSIIKSFILNSVVKDVISYLSLVIDNFKTKDDGVTMHQMIMNANCRRYLC